MNKIILVIRDGWGYRKNKKQNEIACANTPFTNSLMQEYPHTLLAAAGEAVGLQEGFQGNSEVGHLTIGSGRIIFQSMEKINKSIKNGTFLKNPEFLKAINNCKKNNSAMHLIGLIQKEGVHSYIDHLFELMKMCKENNLENVKIHVITDGRDAPVNNSINNLKSLQNKIYDLKIGHIATISGRFFAMDRDKRWERTQKAYDCIINAISEKEEFTNAIDELENCYKTGETDEFIIPRKAKDYSGINNNDSIIFFNFRTDRTRQLTQSLIEPEFKEFNTKKIKIFFVAMTQYYDSPLLNVAFKDDKLNNLLGEVISSNGLKQLRISETEKYPHVTFFFNGQIEKPYKLEDRIMSPSPKVKTYDLKPEMSAYEITDALVNKINENKYDFMVINLVNCDMVGHTGKLIAIRKAVEVVDECTKKIVTAGLNNDYDLLVFADHGNAEDKTPEYRTSHTKNKVPVILISKKHYNLKNDKGLKDIAPTVLDLLKISKPKEMTGESLLC